MKPPPVIAKIDTMSASDRKTLRANAENWVATGRNVADAQAVLDKLDQVEQQERAVYAERVRGLSKTERVLNSFDKKPMNSHEQRLIQVLLDNPGATSAQLGAAIGEDEDYWHLQFGGMCGRRRPDLWEAPEKYKKDGSEIPITILTEWVADSGFIMRPEAAEAFKRLGLVGKTTP